MVNSRLNHEIYLSFEIKKSKPFPKQAFFYASAVQNFSKRCVNRTNCSQRTFLLFPVLRTFCRFFIKFKIVVCNFFFLSVWNSLKFVVWERVEYSKMFQIMACVYETRFSQRMVHNIFYNISIVEHPSQHSLVGSVQYLRIGRPWFDTRLRRYYL